MTAMRAANMEDVVTIQRLLDDAGLPVAGITEHFAEFVIAQDGDDVVGCAGLERYGASALLRSVVVRPQYRSRGLGGRLVMHLLDLARVSGIKNVYLLTTTASEYFRRMGFEEVRRDQIDASVLTSQEFVAPSCATAKAMRLAEGKAR